MFDNSVLLTPVYKCRFGQTDHFAYTTIRYRVQKLKRSYSNTITSDCKFVISRNIAYLIKGCFWQI